MEDPNPKVSGMGIRQLQQRGIRVHVGLLRKESEWLNRGYIKLITTNKKNLSPATHPFPNTSHMVVL